MSEIVMTKQANPGPLGANLVALFFNLSGQPCFVGNDGVEHALLDSPGTYANLAVSANLALSSNIAAANGNATINLPSGRVTANASATSLVVTNNLVTANSHVMAWPSQNDTTGRVTAVVPAAGNFTIHMTAPTANMRVDFVVIGAA